MEPKPETNDGAAGGSGDMERRCPPCTYDDHEQCQHHLDSATCAYPDDKIRCECGCEQDQPHLYHVVKNGERTSHDHWLTDAQAEKANITVREISGGTAAWVVT